MFNDFNLFNEILMKQQNQSNVPIIVFDKKLEELKGKVLFPKKLKKANEVLAKAGLPKTESKK